MPAIVEKKKCSACSGGDRMECVFNCPYDAISLMDDKAEIDPELCDDCKICIDVCPMCAISHE